ncbi:hypothetical protein Raf01_64120 [Rugosimonospora africana]|uniref:Uncharacterized protein n=1 Tax=Rugosimonospora africana TaxID=556532 RepID=A0A8J3QVG6_9ACTN|nr:hypothetical protein Raf01_64120 [Rugosimonospora africana]
MVEPAATQRLHQRFGDVLLAYDLGKRARPVLAIERQCHEYKLPLGCDEKGPPCTRQSPLILAAFRPWGGSRGVRRTRGLDKNTRCADGDGDRYPSRRRIRLEA